MMIEILSSARVGVSEVESEDGRGCKDTRSVQSADTIGSLLIDVNNENDLGKHPHYCGEKQKNSLGTKLKGN